MDSLITEYFNSIIYMSNLDAALNRLILPQHHRFLDEQLKEQFGKHWDIPGQKIRGNTSWNKSSVYFNKFN